VGGPVSLGTIPMIQLTRLNNQPLIINCDLIKLIENAPDTVLTLVTGEKIVVRESSKQVVEKVVEYRRKVLADLPLQVASGAASSAGKPVHLFPVEKT
jgi:flagellar protein FlbD